MANHPSAEKRQRQNLKRRMRNRIQKSRVNTAVRKTIKLLEQGDKEGATKQAGLATKLLDKAAVHGVLHKNNAARRISRLYKGLSGNSANSRIS